MSFAFVRSIRRPSTARILGLALVQIFVSQATTEKDHLMGHEQQKKVDAQDGCEEYHDDSSNDTDDEGEDSDSDTSDEGDKAKDRKTVSSSPASASRTPNRKVSSHSEDKAESRETLLSASSTSPGGQPHSPGVSVEYRNHYGSPVVPARQRYSSYTYTFSFGQRNSEKFERCRCCCGNSTASAQSPAVPHTEISTRTEVPAVALFVAVAALALIFCLLGYCMANGDWIYVDGKLIVRYP